MSEYGDDPHTLAWRVKTLERIEAAIREELYAERIARETAFREARKDLAENYMTRDQLKVEYVSKHEVVLQKRERREWPLIIAASLGVVTALTDLISRAVGT